MKFDPDIHHRRSIRLPGFNYARNGVYFVTICLQGRECLLGGIASGEMRMNEAGRMVEIWWKELSSKFPNVEIDIFSVMPNHFHGIVFQHGPQKPNDSTVGAALCGCPSFSILNGCPESGHSHKEWRPHPKGHPHRGAPTTAAPVKVTTLGDVMDWFKTMTTNAYIRGVKDQGWPSFPGRLWQRNYYERIIRNDNELQRARQYIVENPMKWNEDRENPLNIPAPPIAGRQRRSNP